VCVRACVCVCVLVVLKFSARAGIQKEFNAVEDVSIEQIAEHTVTPKFCKSLQIMYLWQASQCPSTCKQITLLIWAPCRNNAEGFL